MAKANQANIGMTIGCVLAPAVCQSGLGSAAMQIGAGSLFAKFSRDDEREADRVGIEYCVRAGIDPRGIPTMFRTLLAERQRRPDALEGMFSTHPLAEDRVAETEAMIATIDPVVLQSLTTDTRAFQQFKASLKAGESATLQTDLQRFKLPKRGRHLLKQTIVLIKRCANSRIQMLSHHGR
jgi:predicted Zn-dependent protease